MYAVEFEADVKNGMIKIPARYKELNSKHIKVLALIDDSEAKNLSEKKQVKENPQFSDEYIKEHWRELIMTSSTDPLQDDDVILQEEYGAYLSEKYYS